MRYGARALVELAAGYPDTLVSVKELAARAGVSPKYLEHIMRLLKAAGLVKSVRGLRGGYALATPPEACNLADVYRAVEGSTAPVECADDPESCPMADQCPTRDTWVEIKEAIVAVLENTTIRDLLNRRKHTNDSQALTYDI
jgi:Rrf2 family protein